MEMANAIIVRSDDKRTAPRKQKTAGVSITSRKTRAMLSIVIRHRCSAIERQQLGSLAHDADCNCPVRIPDHDNACVCHRSAAGTHTRIYTHRVSTQSETVVFSPARETKNHCSHTTQPALRCTRAACGAAKAAATTNDAC